MKKNQWFRYSSSTSFVIQILLFFWNFMLFQTFNSYIQKHTWRTTEKSSKVQKFSGFLVYFSGFVQPFVLAISSSILQFDDTLNLFQVIFKNQIVWKITKKKFKLIIVVFPMFLGWFRWWYSDLVCLSEFWRLWWCLYRSAYMQEKAANLECQLLCGCLYHIGCVYDTQARRTRTSAIWSSRRYRITMVGSRNFVQKLCVYKIRRNWVFQVQMLLLELIHIES